MTSRIINLLKLLLPMVLLALAGACANETNTPSDAVGLDGTERTPGITDFISADSLNGQVSPTLRDEVVTYDASPGSSSKNGDERTVEEGDIYRVITGHLILNLNAYRGLQIIDFSDVNKPEIIGRYQVSGSPAEAYVNGDTAYILLNNWRGYYVGGDDVTVKTHYGGLILSVDISNPNKPSLIDKAYVQGYIRKSRLTRGGNNAALYVIAGGWAEWENDDGTPVWEIRTVVQSFGVSQRALNKKSQLNLGGYVSDIQATTEALLVARYDGSRPDASSLLTVIDISDPTGVMILGDEIAVKGRIQNQFNMDLHNDVLRVVSGSTWGGTNENYLQTFDAKRLNNLVPINMTSFGKNENLYATLFIGNKAFCVTYRRIDPFHTFQIDDDGIITEMSEFVVSGWNDYFRAVMNDSRLIGIGVNDDTTRTMSVSVYDITDLANPNPLIARADVEANYSWSEASWDHRAFSVLEGVIAVDEGGIIETGLVLLPFSGWNDNRNEYTAAVQIFTFSSQTLTRRGLMVHGTPVRRSFQTDTDLTANLSEAEISLFDTANPDAPRELGRVELAPNFTNVMVFGDHRARIKNGRDYYAWWWGDRAELPPATVEIVPATEHPDAGNAVASFEIPSEATVYQTGDLLVAVTMRAADTTVWPYTYKTEIEVYDLNEPTRPALVGSLTTDRLQPSYGYYGPVDCINCRKPRSPGNGGDVQAIVGGLAFLQRHEEKEFLLESEYYRYWQRITIEVLDLTTPDSPKLAETLELTQGVDGVSMLADGPDVWITTRNAVTVQKDTRSYVRYYIRRFDLSTPLVPIRDPRINVPGELIAVQGNTIYTRDSLWSSQIVETAVARLEIRNGLAVLQAIHRFNDRVVEAMMLDGAGHLLVSHRSAWYLDSREYWYVQNMTILTAYDFEIMAEVDLDDWASLRHATRGRALFQVPGGLLVFNLDDATAPYPQAYFPSWGWPSEILVVGRDVMFAAGRYGIWLFGLDTFNLM
ncbi:MAG: hypothetical protein GY850_15650 [bacterium]|nr:hypothetical protein [bacterium]